MDAKYVIGVPEMDEQHAKILDLTQKVQNAGGDEFEMDTVVLELINYASTHLDSEEEFLQAKGLSDFLKDHKKKHVAFRIKAMDFYDEFRSAESLESKSEVLKRIGSFCETWLLQHIHVEDRMYAELLKKKAS